MSHGGDIYRNNVKLDMSVNVNPVKRPEAVDKAMLRGLEKADCYPDIIYEALRNDLANTEGLQPENVIVGNGASELITAVIRAFRGHKVAMTAPSFTGYEAAADSAEVEKVFIELKPEDDFDISVVKEGLNKLSSGDLLILTDPNNPNGRLIEKSELESILKETEERGIYVLLDECFISLTREGVKAGGREFLRKGQKKLMVIDAITKSFAVPGIRLGFLFTIEMSLAKKIEVLLPEWNVSSVAEETGRAALKEKDYLEESALFISEERERVIEKIEDIACKTGVKIRIFKSDVNFVLLKCHINLYKKMLDEGILIRDCSEYHGLGEGYFRIAIRSKEKNDIFLKTFESVIKEKLPT